MTASERVGEAVDLGLHHGDLVVRRILIDAAKRLIRVAVLSREPTEAALEAYLREHPGVPTVAAAVNFGGGEMRVEGLPPGRIVLSTRMDRVGEPIGPDPVDLGPHEALLIESDAEAG